MKTKTYSKQQLIILLKEWVQKNGEIPSKRQLNVDVSMPSDMAYRKCFGSWGNALKECGFEPKKPFPSEQCKKAVSEAKQVRINAEKEYRPYVKEINKYGT